MEEDSKKTSEYIKRREDQLKRSEEILREINTNLDKIKAKYDI